MGQAPVAKNGRAINTPLNRTPPMTRCGCGGVAVRDDWGIDMTLHGRDVGITSSQQMGHTICDDVHTRMMSVAQGG